jgi:hypothetical protein
MDAQNFILGFHTSSPIHIIFLGFLVQGFKRYKVYNTPLSMQIWPLLSSAVLASYTFCVFILDNVRRQEPFKYSKHHILPIWHPSYVPLPSSTTQTILLST